MRKRFKWDRKKKILVSMLAVILLVAYFVFFNGSAFVYFSIGMTKNTIMKISNQTISTMEADILLADARHEYETVLGTGIWMTKIQGEDFDDYVKQQVKAKMVRVECMNQYAKSKGIVLAKSDKDKAAKAAAEYINQLSSTQKESMNVTVDKVQEVYEKFATAQLLYTELTGNNSIEISADDARVIRIQYVAALSQDAADRAKTMLDNGEAFAAVAKQFNESDAYELDLKRGEMTSEFENVVFELKGGETSPVFSVDGKYYIVRCASDNIKAKTDSNKLILKNQILLQSFNSTFDSFEASKYVEMNTRVWNNKRVAQAQSITTGFEEIFNNYFVN